MKLRPYQQAAVDAIFKAWQKCTSALVVIPTGCGKTIVFASVIKRLLTDSSCSRSATTERPPNPRVIVLAHREELITQARDKIMTVTDADVQIEMADFHVTEYFGQKADVIVSTVQTQNAGPARAKRMNNFDPSEFAALIIDEAHHATARSYRECVDYYTQNPNCRVLGVTATPDRADESALGQVFDEVAYEYSIDEAIRDGWLVPIHQKLVKVESLDFSGVSTSAGDLNQAELSEVMEDEKNLHGIVSPVLSICKGKKTILFATSVKQAERISEIINRSDSMKADWICGATPKEVRRHKLEAFKRGEIDVMCNVGILTEGFDDSAVEVIVMARPTKSRALYAQMAGRATRPSSDIADKLGDEELPEIRCSMIATSSKPSCLIVDFVGNSGRHKLITTTDILGGKENDDDEVRVRAKQIIEERGETDTAEAMEEARAEIEARKAADAKRRAFIKAKAEFVTIEVDPLNIYDLPPVEERPLDRGRHLSLRQEAILRERLKVEPAKVGYAKGKQMIDEMFRRMDAGLASLPQQKQLRRFGLVAPMRFAEASRALSRAFARRGC